MRLKFNIEHVFQIIFEIFKISLLVLELRFFALLADRGALWASPRRFQTQKSHQIKAWAVSLATACKTSGVCASEAGKNAFEMQKNKCGRANRPASCVRARWITRPARCAIFCTDAFLLLRTISALISNANKIHFCTVLNYRVFILFWYNLRFYVYVS